MRLLVLLVPYTLGVSMGAKESPLNCIYFSPNPSFQMLPPPLHDDIFFSLGINLAKESLSFLLGHIPPSWACNVLTPRPRKSDSPAGPIRYTSVDHE